MSESCCAGTIEINRLPGVVIPEEVSAFLTSEAHFLYVSRKHGTNAVHGTDTAKKLEGRIISFIDQPTP